VQGEGRGGEGRGDPHLHIEYVGRFPRDQHLIYPRWNFIFKVGREGEKEER